VAAKENEKEILIGPDEGAHLPILGITHKVTAEGFGGGHGWATVSKRWRFLASFY
jgi:hypothetical protein